MAPPPPPLPEELVEAILLRVPPDDPARLARAALVCKPWRRLLSGRAFRRRFLDRHSRAPPMLGYLYNRGEAPRFVPASSFRPPRAAAPDYPCRAVDARHGRVLLHSQALDFGNHAWDAMDNPLVVWDPASGEQRELPLLPGLLRVGSWNAAVLCGVCACAAAGDADCDHRGPFLVVLVFVTHDGRPSAFVYSSEAGAWSEPVPGPDGSYGIIALERGVLVGDALHFAFRGGSSVLRYELGARELSVIRLPEACAGRGRRIVLRTAEDGGLGFAGLRKQKLHLWSREVDPDSSGSLAVGDDRNAGWAETGVIDLKTLLPRDALSSSLHVAGFADSVDFILLGSHDGLFTIDMRSLRVTKVGRHYWDEDNLPYISFCTPALGAASATEVLRAGCSND
ncbi:hypothetical protein ACP4OV_012061 [Aristida adscensionis]